MKAVNKKAQRVEDMYEDQNSATKVIRTFKEENQYCKNKDVKNKEQRKTET